MTKKVKLADLTFKISDDGSLKVVGNEAQKTSKKLDRTSKSTRDVNRNMQAMSGRVESGTKGFARMQQGTGGLVQSYAILASTLFALGAAFRAMENAANGIAYSSSFYNVDIDNLVEHCQAKFNSYYAGVKNTKLTTFDGGPPVEVTITSPTRLVKSKGGESSLDTGEGKVAKFLPKRRKKKKGGFFQQAFAKTKPSSIQKAIKQAEEDKGDFLTLEETMKVVDNFNKENNIKKKKKKK